MWHTDREKALEEIVFINQLREEGFIYKVTASNIPAQNGPAERSRGMIMKKAKALRIEVKLLKNLWLELFKSAIYIINRTPTKQLGWLMSLKVLNKELNHSNP